MKTADLNGWLLDYWTAKAEGREFVPEDELTEYERGWGEPAIKWLADNGEVGGSEPFSHYGSPSTDWAQGGPIIEREKITVQPWPADWAALWYGPDGHAIGSTARGPTPLIAAMRAFVASKFGEEVPNE